MSYVNHLAKEINCKIVYYGPGLCGKTTNLNTIFARTRPESRGKMIQLATETERTLFFDFLPIDLGSIGGYKVRMHLYTVPGQVFYDASRRLVVRGADGVVFVADSQPARREANIESLENLELNMAENGSSLDAVPCAIQYNKRDIPDPIPTDDLRRDLNPRGVPDFEAAAVRGAGVFETLKGISHMVLQRLASKPIG
jgi:signal recognition particle receptor subunit beta